MNLTSMIPPISFRTFALMVDRTFGALLGSLWAFLPFYTRCKTGSKTVDFVKEKFVDSRPRFRAFTRVDMKPQKASAGPIYLRPLYIAIKTRAENRLWRDRIHVSG